MAKVIIQYGKLLEPFFNFYLKNSPDVKGEGWKEWVPPNKEELAKRIESYKQIWARYEEKVLYGICEALDLSFDGDIEVYIVAGINRDMSNPIIISGHHSPEKFVAKLSHELVHRIFRGTDFKFSKVLVNKTGNNTIDNHILIYAVLRKVFEDEPGILQAAADIKHNEDYKTAYRLSEPYDSILEFFRRNK